MQADHLIDWVILAGGFGTRSADPSLPKVLQKVGGTTLLSRHLGNVAALGPSRVVLVLHYGANQVKAAIEVESSNYQNHRPKSKHIESKITRVRSKFLIPSSGNILDSSPNAGLGCVPPRRGVGPKHLILKIPFLDLGLPRQQQPYANIQGD